MNTLTINMYLDWVNNFLSVPVFAQHYGFTIKQAEDVIKEGRLLHEQSVFADEREVYHD